ncbi:hypothetical protein FACS189442_1580 [Spirochaetia bacterium]|nr:hypothetical protein FACS189442_1580 [Spirochaetia bacterium]
MRNSIRFWHSLSDYELKISVSRRCDIPRFRFDWFLERLDTGYAEAVNPYNKAQIRRVSLLPQEVTALIFWTRDPRPILAHAKELEVRGYRFYVMVTLTGYPAVLEPNVPPPEAIIAAMGELAEKIGPERVIWRYDPIFLSSLTDSAFHLRNFEALAEALAGKVRRVIISVYDEYGGAKGRLAALEKAGSLTLTPHYQTMNGAGRLLPEVRALLGELAAIAANAGLEIQSCAEEDLSADPYEPQLGIKAGACIDAELIRRLFPQDTPPDIETGKKDKYQRPHCRCVPSVDIGAYGPCPAGCVYCYAWR